MKEKTTRELVFPIFRTVRRAFCLFEYVFLWSIWSVFAFSALDHVDDVF